MSCELASILIGTSGLTLALLASLLVTVGRPRPARAAVPRIRVLALTTVAMQAAHFGEELTTGFHTQFPQRFGLAPWPTSFFVVFNLAWLVIWCVAVALLRSGGRAAAFPIWFLAIAGLANGVVHPALAFSVGGYFPGLWTSPAIGIAGLLLLRGLVQTTAFDPNHRPAES